MQLIKKIVEKIFLLISLLIFGLVLVCQSAKAQENKVKMYFFWAQGCPHCEKEKVFLNKLVKKYSQLEVKSLEISNPENQKLWRQAAEKLNAQFGYTPFTVIGDRYFTGYLNDETTGRQIENAVKEAIKSGCQDIFQEASASPESCPVQEKTIPEQIKIPLMGEVKIKNLSLPLLTLILGLADGFNPCAMWSLLFLISLLLGMNNRKRMWFLGGTFIFVSGLVYFLFMTAWLNFFLFVSFIPWMKILIGFTALAAGGYNIRGYFFNKEHACKVTGSAKRRKVFEKMKNIAQQPKFFLALTGIILLAFAVNLVELFCSVGLPAVYTQILTLSRLKSWQYYLYLAGYIFFYMLDDMVVFFVAMITLKVVGIEKKYGNFSQLIGGIVMLAIGLLLLFKPEWLMFG